MNRILEGPENTVTIRRPRTANPEEFDSKTLAYGEEWNIIQHKDLEPHRKLTLFTFQSPLPATAPDTSTGGQLPLSVENPC